MVEPTALRKPEDTSDDTEPGLDIGYQRSLGAQGEHGQMSFRTMFGAKTALKDQVRIVNGLVSLAEITEARAKLRSLRKELALAEARLAEPQDEQQKRRDEIAIEIGALHAHRADRRQAMEAEFRGSGRQGKWKPVGAELRELESIGQEIGKLEKQAIEIGTALDTRKPQLELAVKNWKVAIANLERDIDVLNREASGE